MKNQLPACEGLVCEILSRLPVISLMRFKCVCKRWKSIIEKHEFFIDSHFSRLKETPPTRTFSLLHVCQLHTNRRMRFFSAELFLPSEEEEDERVKVRHVRLWKAWKPCFLDQHLVCTVDGLASFMNKASYRVRVYNSSTNESTPWIDKPTKQPNDRRLAFLTHALGYDHTKKEYKVVALWNISHRVVCEVLTVRQNSWRRIDGVPYILPDDRVSSIYMNGSIYFLCKNPYYRTDLCRIVEFNVGSEQLRIVATARYDNYRDVRDCYLMEIDGRLCLSTYDRQDKTRRTIKMHVLYDDHGENNIHWVEAQPLLLPFHTELNAIRHIPRTDLFIVRSVNEKESSARTKAYYHYIWNNKRSDVDINITQLLSDETEKKHDLGFDLFTPNLFRVN